MTANKHRKRLVRRRMQRTGESYTAALRHFRSGTSAIQREQARVDVPPDGDDQFYRELILDHYRNPRNYGRITGADISHEEHNALCGDVVGLDLRLRDGVIEEVAFHGRGCAISQASASLMTERLVERSLVDARGISREDVLGDLGIEISPARLECALLPLKVLKVGVYSLAV
jgi:nitrogen fixation protein NifU and related proteins